MITATASLPTTTLTPVVDGAVTTTLTTATGVPSSEGFSNALTAQLNLLAQPVTNATVLATTQATISAITTSQATVTPIATELLTNPEMVSPIAQQTVITTNASSINPTPTANPSVTTGTSLLNTSIDSTAATTMSAEDTAILSAVTDTLKFITSGSKLGDTLPAGQSVQLPTANSATALTQQSMQAAVKQAVTNTQINTPANVLAQQVTPVQVVQTAATTAQTEIVTTPQIPVSATFVTPAQAQIVETPQTPVVTPAQTQTVVTAQTPMVEAVVTPVQAQTEVTPQTPVIETPVTTTAQAQTVVAPQTPVIEKPVTTTAQAQTVTTPQTSAVEKPVTTNSQVQAVTTPQTPVVETPVTTVAQTQTVVASQTSAVETPVTTTAQTQTVTTPQTPVVEAPVKPVQVQTEVAKQQASVAETSVIEKPDVQKTLVTASDLNQSTVTEQTQQDVGVQVSQGNTPKIANQTPVATDIVTAPQLAETTPSLLTAAQQSVSAKAKNSDNIAPIVTTESEHKTVENQDTPVVQVVPDIIVAPQVAAQAAPPVQAKTENVAVETTSDTITQEKPTLTSAKTLLMDAVANRNSTGDAGNNSNNGNNSSSNSTLQNAALLNPVDSKQNVEPKSFASLLTSEKTDTFSASATAPTGDKSTSQVISSAVNKLVQDTKMDVPAMTKPLTHPEWNQDLGERIVWMNNKGISSAEIKMNPQNMGPISVRIDMNQDQATIAFTAQNSMVRDALEASIPKLREMLNSQQVNLAEVNVSQQSSTSADSGRSQQFAQMADTSANGQGNGNRHNNPELDAQGNPINASNSVDGTVDEFANGQVISSNGTNGLLSIYA